MIANHSQRLANIRLMLDHFDKVQERYLYSNTLDDAVLLRDWTLRLLDGEPYNWIEFTLELMELHHMDHAISEEEVANYKREIGVK